AAAVEDAGSDQRLLEAAAAFREAGRIREETGKYAEAVVQAERALALREAVLGGSHLQVAECLHLLGQLNWQQGDNAKAEQYLLRAIHILEGALGQEHIEVAKSLNVLGNVH